MKIKREEKIDWADEFQALDDMSEYPAIIAIPEDACSLTNILSAIDALGNERRDYDRDDDIWAEFESFAKDVDSGRYDDTVDEEGI